MATVAARDGHLQIHLRELALSGFTIIEQVIPRSEVAAVHDSVVATVDRSGSYSDKGVGFLAGLLNHDRAVVPYLLDDRLMGTVEAALGEHVHLSFASAIINAPRNARGGWHADWPFNQNNAGHVRAPYPDAVMHLTSLWMLSPFSAETGGTLVVPGSHRADDNPTGDNDLDPMEPMSSEINATGDPGDVLLFDSRLWHATAENRTDQPRVALALRYAPWWLNVDVLRPGTSKRAQMVDEPGARENEVPGLDPAIYDELPPGVQQLVRHGLRPTSG